MVMLLTINYVNTLHWQCVPKDMETKRLNWRFNSHCACVSKVGSLSRAIRVVSTFVHTPTLHQDTAVGMVLQQVTRSVVQVK